MIFDGNKMNPKIKKTAVRRTNTHRYSIYGNAPMRAIRQIWNRGTQLSV